MKNSKNTKVKNKNDMLNIISLILPIICLSIINNIFVMMAIFIIQIFTIMCNIKKYKINFKAKEKNILIILILFFLTSVIIDLIGNYFYSTIKTTILIFLSIFLIFFTISTDKNKIKNVNKSFEYIVFFTLFLVIYSIILRKFGSLPSIYQAKDGLLYYRQYINLFGIKLYQNICGDIKIKYAVASLTGNPNTLSSLIDVSVAFMFLDFIMKGKEKNFPKKFMDFLMITILLYGAYIAHSRMGILILALLIPLCIIIKLTIDNFIKKQAFYFLLFISMISVILIIVIKPDLINKVDLNGREIMWNVAKSEINENVLKLNGLGSSGLVIKDITGKSISMHNAYLAFIIDYGILLFIIFLCYLIFKLIINMNYIINPKSKEKTLYAKLLIIFICLLLNGFSEGTFMTYSMYNYMFFICLFSMSLLKGVKGENDDNNFYPNIQ